jgi:hypothetical protein
MKTTMQWDELHRRFEEILPPQSQPLFGRVFYQEPTAAQRMAVDALVCEFNLTAPKMDRVVPPRFDGHGLLVDTADGVSVFARFAAHTVTGGLLTYEPEKGGYVIRFIPSDLAIEERDEDEDDET